MLFTITTPFPPFHSLVSRNNQGKLLKKKEKKKMVKIYQTRFGLVVFFLFQTVGREPFLFPQGDDDAIQRAQDDQFLFASRDGEMLLSSCLATPGGKIEQEKNHIFLFLFCRPPDNNFRLHSHWYKK